MLGYVVAEVSLRKFKLASSEVMVGHSLAFSFSITSTAQKNQPLPIDYNLYFRKENGELSLKTFKIAKTTIKPGETLQFNKRQLLRPMTTRVLHLGQHEVEIQINEMKYPRKGRALVAA